MLSQTVEISRKPHPNNRFGLKLSDIVHTVEYRMHNIPYRQIRFYDLPENYELEDWESEDDIWFRINGLLYNLNEFCRIGSPRIDGPRGGAQTASNGHFMIAAYEGEIYSVRTIESKPVGF